jgi:hypothetical protein
MILAAALLLAGCGGGEEPAKTSAPKPIGRAEPHTDLRGALRSVNAGRDLPERRDGRPHLGPRGRAPEPPGRLLTNELVRGGLPQYFGD